MGGHDPHGHDHGHAAAPEPAAALPQAPLVGLMIPVASVVLFVLAALGASNRAGAPKDASHATAEAHADHAGDAHADEGHAAPDAHAAEPAPAPAEAPADKPAEPHAAVSPAPAGPAEVAAAAPAPAGDATPAPAPASSATAAPSEPPAAEEPAPEGFRTISVADLKNRIRGGWVGQMIGVAYGTPTEFRALGELYEKEILWEADMLQFAYRQDDLYVEMTFAEVMDTVGLEATTAQYGEAFRDSKYHLWHANAGARRNLNRGIPAPDSGHPKYNIHANDIDFQIEADFIGLMCPGLPVESNKYCDRVGRVMNYGDGVYGGMFVSGMYAEAFFESNPRRIVEAGLACIPAESRYARTIADTLAAYDRHPQDWRAAWKEVNGRWDVGDDCTDGALRPFNIDASLNGAFIAFGLLWGEGDFEKTMEISTRCGQDSDCNPASAAGVLGVVLGFDRLAPKWVSKLAEYEAAGTRFQFTNYTLPKICETTLERARLVVKGAGGRFEKGRAFIPVQAAVPPPLEQWDMGDPRKIVPATDPAWTYGGTFQPLMNSHHQMMGMLANGEGEATLVFEGTAIAVVGHHRGNGGRADVFIDGAKVGEIDQFTVENTNDNDLFHAYDLPDGRHELKIVPKLDAEGAIQKDPRVQGKARLLVEGAIVFGPVAPGS